MSVTYNPNLGSNGVWNVRFLLQDGTGNTPYVLPGGMLAVLQDEEISANLTNNGWNDGLSACAAAMATFCAQLQQAGSEKDSSRTWWAERAPFYSAMADNARAGAYPDPDAPVRLITQIVTASVQFDPCCDLLL